MSKDFITFNDNEFKKALNDYAKVSSKDTASILNAKMKDLMFKSAKATPKANKADIDGLKSQGWWLGYLAKNVSRELGGLKVSKKQYLSLFKKMERKIISGRKRAVSYLQSGFIKSAKQINKFDKEQREGKESELKIPNKFDNVKTTVLEARPKSQSSIVNIEWGSDDSTDANTKTNILNKAMKKAIPIVTRDMYKYIERKLAQEAKKISK